MFHGKIFAALLAAVLILFACSKEQQPAKSEESVGKNSQAPAAQSAGPSDAGQGNGKIVGNVIFKGRHSAGKLSVGRDREVCGKDKSDPSLIVGSEGGIKNAVVQISGLRRGKAPKKEAVIDQQKCEYAPHVLVGAPGTTVAFKNSDGILHNVHTLSRDNPPFNRAQPKFVKEIKETFDKPEVVAVRCDVHGWMSGWIVVTENSFFAVTQSDGAFKLDDVPAGNYTLEVWHESLGEATQAVQLKAGETLNVTFEFQKK